MKRQGLIITIKQLIDLALDLTNETDWYGFGIDVDREFQVNIINKEGLSDTWELEE